MKTQIDSGFGCVVVLVVFSCFQLFSVVFSCFQLFSVVFSCFQLFSVVFSCFQLFSVVFSCFQLFFVSACLLGCHLQQLARHRSHQDTPKSSQLVPARTVSAALNIAFCASRDRFSPTSCGWPKGDIAKVTW